MPITEDERSEMVNTSSDLPDLRTASEDLRAELADLREHFDSALAKYVRVHMTSLVAFLLANWATMIVFVAIFD